MRELLVDIGNSRVKWAILERGRLGEQRAAAHADWVADDWRRALFGGLEIDRVLARYADALNGSAAAADIHLQIGKSGMTLTLNGETLIA